jgi:hypothetical protein
MEFDVVDIEKGEDIQCIIGHAGFIKTTEDLYEAMMNACPTLKFGIGFVEASGPGLVRGEGNDHELEELAKKNAFAIAAGHSFIIMFRGAFPINVANAIKHVPEVSRILCATANPVQVIVGITNQGKAIISVVDGSEAKGIEADSDKKERREFLRKIGYKL